MALENIFDSIVKGFFWIFDAKFLNLFVLTIFMTISMLIIWVMYMHLSKKDIFSIPISKKGDSKLKSFLLYSAYTLKYVLVFPVYSFLWFVLFSMILILMSSSADPQNILYFGIVLIASIRVTAYISEKLSEDISKLFPLTLFSSIIVNPGFLSLDLKEIIGFFSVSSIHKSLYLFPSYLKYLFFIILLEWILRIGASVIGRIIESRANK